MRLLQFQKYFESVAQLHRKSPLGLQANHIFLVKEIASPGADSVM
jgi:hypothetical protein